VFSGSRDRTIRMWRGSDGKLLHTKNHHKDSVLSLALGPDDTVVSGSGGKDKTVALWCGHTGDHLGTLSHLPDIIDALAVGPEGEVYTGGRDDKTITVW